MGRSITIFPILLGFCLAVSTGQNEPAKAAPLRLMLSEVQPGAMATEQYCMLVFADRHYHAETANRKLGKDRVRKVYEGGLSESDWNALGGILDSKEFRDLKVPSGLSPMVIQDSHPFTISVAREKGFQNMEFLTKANLKPYEPQVKPLLQWWKSLRGRHMAESDGPTDSRCSLNSNNGIFSN